MALLACVLAVVSGPTVVARGAAEPAWGVEQLMVELGRVQHAKAGFIERKHLKILKKPLEITGTLEYRAPDHVARHTLTPKPESFVVDGDRLVLENARGQRRNLALQDNPVLWAFVESIRSTLKGDLATLDRFYQVTLEGGPESWQLALSPKEPRMRAIIDVIRMSGINGRIEAIEIREAQGDWSEMTIHEDER